MQQRRVVGHPTEHWGQRDLAPVCSASADWPRAESARSPPWCAWQCSFKRFLVLSPKLCVVSLLCKTASDPPRAGANPQTRDVAPKQPLRRQRSAQSDQRGEPRARQHLHRHRREFPEIELHPSAWPVLELAGVPAAVGATITTRAHSFPFRLLLAARRTLS